uniref:Geranylgeranyl pyrophosphate synthase n=1 Tax=Rhodnius prolixus TaxID=13249 RepID=T1H7T2_RHOPR
MINIDDIQDNSILRRGIPVAHSIYGVASTINAANYVFFLALDKVLALGHPEATTVYTEQLLELHRGQGMEIYWRDNFTCPTEDEYKTMTIKSKNSRIKNLAILESRVDIPSNSQKSFKILRFMPSARNGLEKPRIFIDLNKETILAKKEMRRLTLLQGKMPKPFAWQESSSLKEDFLGNYSRKQHLIKK